MKQRKMDSDITEYNPLIIKTFMVSDNNHYSVMELGGYLLQEDTFESMIYNDYMENLLKGEDIKTGTISTMEIALADLLNETCLTESGFTADGNQLMLFANERVYTVIDDIETNVQGVIKLSLLDDINESIIVMCYDRNILISDDFFYIDAPKKVVA